MRRIMALILSMVLAFTVSTTAFASEIYDDSEMQTATGEIVYTLDTSYCIQIPERIDATAAYTFTAYYVNLTEAEQVGVRMSGVNEVSQLELTNDTGDFLTFGVWYNNAVIAPDNVVAVFTDSTTSNGALEIIPDMGAAAHRAGEYSGIFEFTVSVEPRT